MKRPSNKRLWAARNRAMLVNVQPILPRSLVFALWFPAPILQMVLVGWMYRRKLASEFRVFFVYLVFHVVRTLLLLGIGLKYSSGGFAYFYAFWASEVVDIGLGIAVVYELYSMTFRRYPALAQLGRVLFSCSLAILLAIAAINASAGQRAEHGRLMAGLLMMDRSAGILRGGLLLLLFMFARALGLSWRHCVFGIAAGFSLTLGVELVGYTASGYLGVVAAPTLVLVNLVAYDCANLVWLSYFVQREPVLAVRTPLLQGNLDKWNQALAELVYRT